MSCIVTVFLLSFRLLGFAELADGSGVLTVGGLSASDFYTGTLQDVRVYAGPLTERFVSH